MHLLTRILPFPALLLTAVAAVRPLEIELGPQHGALASWMQGDKRQTLPTGGGFQLIDPVKRVSFPLSAIAPVAGENAVAQYSATDGKLRLTARFMPTADYVRVEGTVENLQGDERGVIVEYRIRSDAGRTEFSNNLGPARTLAGGASNEGNVFPLAALSGKDTGWALAIPPNEPRVFGMGGDADGMYLRFYLGLSPRPQRFPNRATFVFLIYPVAGPSGFRTALANYYAFFPDYYTPRLKKDGLFMFQVGDRAVQNADQYGFDEVEPQWSADVLQRAIDRDDKHEISTLPYTIVGQREIKFLPTLPASYDEALGILSRWKLSDHAGHPVTKENVTSEGDRYLREEIESSACQTADGRYAMVFRETGWGGKSITFKINPNPELFADSPRHTVGADTLALATRWMNEHPSYDGVYVDSLGANWPAVLNYRQDHFAYARYPLTFDPSGRVALQNELSHYEYIETLRAQLRPQHRIILGNGIYAYPSRATPKSGAEQSERQTLDRTFTEYTAVSSPPEHYRAGTRLGRFFCAALIDVGSSEAGVRATVEQCQEVRAMLGRKQYAFLNYHWEDRAQLETLINRSLCYAIFASSSTNFMTGIRYEDHPQGYLRDKALLDWYVPLVRMLSRAGWEPVRHARIEGAEVVGERFGHANEIYFTLYNDASTAQKASLTIDYAALQLDPHSIVLREMAEDVPLAAGQDGRIEVEIPAQRTRIVRVTAVK